MSPDSMTKGETVRAVKKTTIDPDALTTAVDLVKRASHQLAGW